MILLLGIFAAIAGLVIVATLGTIIWCLSTGSALLAAALTVAAMAVGFTLWCYFVDSDHWDVKTDTNSFFVVFCRIYAKNVKLALKIVFFAMLAVVIVQTAWEHVQKKAQPKADGGGPEVERFFRFLNLVTAPAQWLVDFLMAVLVVIAACVVLISRGAYLVAMAHPVAVAATAICLYGAWLTFTSYRVVQEEYTKKLDDAAALQLRAGAALGARVALVASCSVAAPWLYFHCAPLIVQQALSYVPLS